MTTYTNQVQAGQNLSTIAQNAGMTSAQFLALNPHLGGSNSTYQGLNNNVAVGTGYNLTAPANTLPQGSTGSPTASNTTIATPTGSYQSPETIAAQQAQTDYLNSLNNPDENSIYQQKLAQMQASIDATNNMYADELARAKVTGRGRLGTATAIAGRRGLIGSDFGNAQYDTQEQGNEDVYRSIENERLAKVNAIMSQAKTDASAEYRNKRDEFTKGLDARLAYYQGADQRKADNASKAAKAIIAQGLDINTIDPTSLSSFAKYYGLTPEDIKATYATEKKAYDAEQTKLSQDATKSLPASAQEYEYAKKNGYTGTFNQYQNEDANRKAKASGSGGTKQSVASKEGTDVADIISFFKNKMVQNNWKGINPDDYNKYRTKLLKQYGSAAVSLLDNEIEKSGISVDNG